MLGLQMLHVRCCAVLLEVWGRVQVYVQDKIRENGQALCNALVNDGASLFVCGDGAHMARMSMQLSQTSSLPTGGRDC